MTTPDRWVLAVDIGTTSTKALAVTPAGRVLGEHRVPYALRVPAPGRAELDPDEIVRAVETTARRVAAEAGGGCLGTVFSTFMHGLIALDGEGSALTACWTWADRRAAPQAARLHANGSAPRLLARSGTPVHALSPLCKLLWMKENEPSTFAAARRFVSIKEYVMAALCTAAPVDYGIASSSGLFDLHERAWNAETLRLVGIEPERLSAIVSTRHVVEAQAGGALPEGPVVIGSSDGALANLGAGATSPGIVAVTLGGSGAVRAVVPAPAADPNGQLFCYALTDDLWVVGGATQNAGLVVRWLARLLPDCAAADKAEELERLIAQAAEVPAGADGLLCLPLLAGERFPAWRPDASGMLAGLRREHDRRHIARAALEGIVCCIETVVRALERFTQPAREVRFGGGFARSAWVRQMLADVLDRRVAMPQSEQSSALGAARLAFDALGIEQAWDERVAHVHEPDPAAAVLYGRIAELQRELYQRNEGLLRALAEARKAEPPPRP